ncbi:MAG TPA: tRNA preQ1(34) S-adenosylmethionine ribosyltransferase-isomerase QueA [Flavobacteriales bacterium]|nr:tRNA preQ1(34) S-adenosylmethionine ribosyltransferase-isomerase QueA [Flavobacteriales bacterium]HIK62749.1 tRNA preQ1(34) S-adenosylmethionine ribosyltransferase-isomerase QueA [Flavobacteriales bacterium]
MKYKLSMFNFDLPQTRIAKTPNENREDAKLMVVHKSTGEIEHKNVSDLGDYFDDGDVVVTNNTKVFPARLYAKKEKTGAKIEVFLLRELNKENRLWDVLVDPARKIRIGNKLFFGENEELIAEVIDNTTSRGRTLRFLLDGTHEEFKEVITSLGSTPLPKHIDRNPTKEDTDRFQTIYAKHEGAVSAPTAGLHFSKLLMKQLELQGVEFAETTLHVGLGTFNQIMVEDLSKHKMESEEIIILGEAAAKINNGKNAGKRICAVGTTVMRVLESSVSTKNEIIPYTGWTNIFLFPPYTFRIANCMLTNFHLPKSSLMMQVAAFSGLDLLKEAYKEALKKKYNFHTFGDAMLIL